MASNNQHLNGPSIWASISASICQHLASIGQHCGVGALSLARSGSPVCCALSLYPLYWGVTSSIAGIANQFNSRHQAHVFGAVMCPTLWARKHTGLYFPSICSIASVLEAAAEPRCAPHRINPGPARSREFNWALGACVPCLSCNGS